MSLRFEETAIPGVILVEPQVHRDDRGFFLVVEGGRIDHAHHEANAYRALTDTIAFANAVRVARRKTDCDDTLIIVTADHSNPLTIAGYSARGHAILGKVRPGDMGFDVIHMNLHKTFSTPHGGGGPGAGPVGVSQRLEPYLPVPMVEFDGSDYCWLTEKERPESMGRLSAFAGNAGVLLRAYIYARLLGKEGMHRVAEFSTLNANYLLKRLMEAGFDAAYPERRASHEFILTLKRQAKELGVNTMDFAKRMLDYGVHAPTTYFPLLVPECLLVEPTETEAKEELDNFVEIMKSIKQEAETQPEMVKQAPHTMPVRRLDDVRAARELDLAWRGDE